MVAITREKPNCSKSTADAAARTSVETTASETDVALDIQNGHEGPMPLEQLLCKGFTAKDLELLRSAGLHTVECVAFAPNKIICDIKGISEQKCEKVKEASKSLLGLGFCSATSFLEARQNLIRFTTGSTDLDSILRGGVESGSITEIAGEYRTGKTQLCHTLAVTCQLPIEMAGGEGKCLWIDTEGTFRPERLVTIAERFDLTPNVVLNNIIYARAFNTDHLLSLLIEAAAILTKARFALLIIDSIISLNQVMAKVDGMPGSDKQPTGGHVLAHASQTRLFMRKGRGINRICKIIDSPSLPECEAQFSITDGGIDKADG